MNERAEHSYSDQLLLPPGSRLSYPEIHAIDASQLLVSAWGGYCFYADPAKGTIRSGPVTSSGLKAFATAFTCPSSAGLPALCALATRSGWAVVWHAGAPSASEIYPEGGGSVNSVAVVPEGRGLALGLGYYPLSSNDDPRATVELWSVEPEMRLAARTVPGVVIDRLAWSPDGTMLLVTTGARCQTRGFLGVLDGKSLSLLDVVETPACGYLTVAIVPDREEIVMVSRDLVEVREASEPADVLWRIPLETEVSGAAVSAETAEVFLSSGICINLRARRVVQLEQLTDCVGIAVRPGGGFYGISQSGTLRCWKPKKKYLV